MSATSSAGADKASANTPIPAAFVTLMALLLALSALSIDTIIPAMANIAESYSITNANDAQLLISAVLLGIAIGQLLFGAIADSHGRKVAMYWGGGLYIASCIGAMIAPSFELLIFTRFLQGAGASATRVAPVAMVRDRYKGPAMARIMSLVVSVFILVPAIAPLLGQAILQFSTWPAIFGVMVVMSAIGLLWLGFGMEETLAPEHRNPLSFASFKSAAIETLAHPITRGYTIASGFVFAALVAYLNSAQQLLQFQYKLGDNFVFAFGALALGLGVVSFANSMLVQRFGLKTIVYYASVVFVAVALTMFAASMVSNGQPPLALFFGLLLLSFMSFGALFGNYNALAIAPMGHIAGVASSVTSCVQSIVSVTLGGFIAYMYDGSTIPIGIGFALLALLNFWQMKSLDDRGTEAAAAGA